MEKKTITIKSTVTQEIEKQIQVPAYFKEPHSPAIYRLNEDETMDLVFVSDSLVQIVKNPYEWEKKLHCPASTVEEWDKLVLKAKEQSDKFFAENLIPSREEIETK